MCKEIERDVHVYAYIDCNKYIGSYGLLYEYEYKNGMCYIHINGWNKGPVEALVLTLCVQQSAEWASCPHSVM